LAATTTSADEALILAIKLSVDAKSWDRARQLIEVAERTTPKPATITPLASRTTRGGTVAAVEPHAVFHAPSSLSAAEHYERFLVADRRFKEHAQ
jgi:hypothetical protein